MMALESKAAWKVEITNKDDQAMSKEFDTEAEADAYIANMEAKEQWGKDVHEARSCLKGFTTQRDVTEDEETYILYMCNKEYSTTKTDITSERLQRDLEKLAAKNIECGRSVKAYIGAVNVSKLLTSAQIKQMLNTYEEVNRMLDGGALDTAIEEMNALTPDGILISESDRTNIIAKINGCKASFE